MASGKCNQDARFRPGGAGAYQFGAKTRRGTDAKTLMCAENLLLLGELLQGAVECVRRCQETFDEEHGPMVELACEEIPQLRQMVETISRKLNQLEGRLRKKCAMV